MAEAGDPRYEHDAGCDGKPESFHPLNERGLKTCKQCAAIFDKDGKGVALSDTRLMDPNWEPGQGR